MSSGAGPPGSAHRALGRLRRRVAPLQFVDSMEDDVSNLIGLTPGERDAAKLAIQQFTRNRVCAESAVDAAINAINEHRERVNILAEQHGCHR